MTQVYSVEFVGKGTIKVAEDEKILVVAERENLDLPSSCNAGVCTTCAAKIISGEVEQSEGMGLSNELQKENYVLLCVAHPRSDLKIELNKEDEVYQRQFGQPGK